MTEQKRKALEANGWQVGTMEQLLALSVEESAKSNGDSNRYKSGQQLN